MLDANDGQLDNSEFPDKEGSRNSSQEMADLSYKILLDESYMFRGYRFSREEVENFSLGAHTHRINIAQILSVDEDPRLEFTDPRNQALSDLIQLLELDNSREDEPVEPVDEQKDISEWGHNAWGSPTPDGFSTSPVPADYKGNAPQNPFDKANMENDLAGFILYYVGRKLNRRQIDDVWNPEGYGRSLYHQQEDNLGNRPWPAHPSPAAQPPAIGGFDLFKRINLEPGELDAHLKEDLPLNNTRAQTWQHGEAEEASLGAMTMFGEGSAEYRDEEGLENSLFLAPSDVEKRVDAFMDRYLKLKRHPESEKNDTLQMGLDILELMIETDPKSLLSLDSADRPKIIAKMVKAFIESEWDEKMSLIRNQHEEGYLASKAFADRHTIHPDKDRHRKLQQAYLSHMAIFALRMLIYEYQCVKNAEFSGANQLSALVVTKNGSFVRVSPASDGRSLREVYEKIALRDYNASHEEVIHESSLRLSYFYNKEGESLQMSKTYSPTLILATKSGDISPSEEIFSAQTCQATWQNDGEPLI